MISVWKAAEWWPFLFVHFHRKSRQWRILPLFGTGKNRYARAHSEGIFQIAISFFNQK